MIFLGTASIMFQEKQFEESIHNLSSIICISQLRLWEMTPSSVVNTVCMYENMSFISFIHRDKFILKDYLLSIVL